LARREEHEAPFRRHAAGNLAGLPGISVPCGMTSDNLPIGAQLLGKPLDEVTLLRVGHVIEQQVGLGSQRPKAVS